MMRFCLIIAVLFYLLVPLKRSLHMLQQNRYQSGRYRAWLKENSVVNRRQVLLQLAAILPLCALAVLNDQPASVLFISFCYVLYGLMWCCYEQRQTYIKKLTVTYRIRRLALVQLGLLWLIIALEMQICSWRTVLALLPFTFFLPWLTLLLALWLLAPVEKRIRARYVQEARQILSQRDDLLRIGITGSYGKTSVKHILAVLLSQRYYTYKTPHSYNNLMGLTLSIRTQLKPLHQVFIAEMGADHVGEITALADLVQPDIAIITAIGPQHLSTFGSQEQIVHEKMRLVEALPPDGIAVLNVDNSWIRNYPLAFTGTIITYGIHQPNAMVKAGNIHYHARGTWFDITTSEGTFKVATRLLGEHNVLNILGAVACASALHVPYDQMIAAIKQLPYTEHRLQAVDMGTYTLLDDAYNANPQGADYALEVLKAMSGRRFLLTPGFLDLGEATKQAHQEYARKMAECADEIILIGKQQTTVIAATLRSLSFPEAHLHTVDTTVEAFACLREQVKQGDVALIENDLPDAFNH